jgi:hypothetical protein
MRALRVRAKLHALKELVDADETRVNGYHS